MLQVVYSEQAALAMPNSMAPDGEGHSASTRDHDGGCRAQLPAEPIWVVLIPFPAFGHVSPMVDLSRAILRHAGGRYRPLIAYPAFTHRRLFPSSSRTPAAAADGVAAVKFSCQEDNTDGLQQEEQDGIVFVGLPDGGIADNPDFFQIDAAMQTRMPKQLDALLHRLGRVACVVVDLLACWAIQVAERRGIRVAGFWPAMSATYRIISAAPVMIQKGLITESGIPIETESPLAKAVGGGPAASLLTTRDLPWLVGDEASQKARFGFWQRIFAQSQSLSSVILNSFANELGDDNDNNELLGKDAGYHSNGARRRCFIHLAAVLQQDHTTTANTAGAGRSYIKKAMIAHTDVRGGQDVRDSCMEWLARWAPSSVVYLSFGTWVGKIGEDKVNEIALGLEATGSPFLLVLKDSWRKGLPAGFLDRVGERAKLVNWAPQRDVLRHEAVGCFITHCGWNSTMEAIRFGKCLVCCPISGDQFINSTHIVSVWKVGVRLSTVERKCVVSCIRKVLAEAGRTEDSGEENSMRSRMYQLRERMIGNQIHRKAKNNLNFFLQGLTC